MKHVPVLVVAFLAACQGPPSDPVDFEDWGIEAADAGWTVPADDPAPPPAGGAPTLSLLTEAFAGGELLAEVSGLPAGTRVTMLGSISGLGDGPCHPQEPSVCTELLQPRILTDTTADGAGIATFVLRLPPQLDGPVGFQAYAGGAVRQLSNVASTLVASRSHVWANDLLDLTIAFGESGYDFGMAETDSPAGWFAEDCLDGQYGMYLCHPIPGDGVVLQSVHPDLGGAGVPAVVPGSTTLFYEPFDPAITYALFGNDSGQCWAWGHDVSYYADCTPLR